MFAANAIYGDIFANDDGSLPVSLIFRKDIIKKQIMSYLIWHEK